MMKQKLHKMSCITDLMIPYESFRYIYPPRPDKAIDRNSLVWFTGYVAQPKLNGDCMMVYTDGTTFHIYNRHGKSFKHDQSITKWLGGKPNMFHELHRGRVGSWMCVVGEFMNKSKVNEYGENWNGNFVIFDIIVYDGLQMIGSTFMERMMLLDALYGNDDKEITSEGVRQWQCLTVTDIKNVYKVKNFGSEDDASYFSLFDKLTKIDMIEGLVLKMPEAKLENGITASNNMSGQVKVRKSTKNYTY